VSLGLLTRYGLTRPLTWVEVVPDATFRAALESEGITTVNLLRAATAINLSAYDLTGADWGGIEYATSVTYLHLGNTSVTGDLSAVSGLTSLTYLRLANTSVLGDISAVSGLTNLTVLHLGNTSVLGDISAVSGLTNLTYLRLSNTSVSGATSPTVSTQDSLNNIRLESMALDQAAVDTVLADLVTSLSPPSRVPASVQLQGNAAPSTPDDVNTLVSAGWTVTTD